MKSPTVRKPGPKKALPATKSKPYVVQVGHAAIASQTHRFDTENKARAWVRRLVLKLKPDFERYNKDGVAMLAIVLEDIDDVIFERDKVAVDREVDKHTGQRLYFEFWRESS